MVPDGENVDPSDIATKAELEHYHNILNSNLLNRRIYQDNKQSHFQVFVWGFLEDGVGPMPWAL